GVEINPMPGVMLSEVEVEREADGNLVFWGATGIATSDVAVGGAAGAGGTAGTAGAGGTAGAAGSAGGGGNGGASAAGAAGSGGAAGVGGTFDPIAGAAGTTSAAGTAHAGSGGSAGAAAAQGGAAVNPVPPSDTQSGCGLTHGEESPTLPTWLTWAAVAVGLLRKRRRAA
ncbi:MAG TPA: hypothetical protein VHO25_05000, partial [Polyangiaceae bacterium]|nr:hypothetical protein [Polyangiaceae bacterium]